MNKKRSGCKGFTLIEILIVVVVIGILASLILPRMLSAPEKAIAAEANQMLGAMIRAQKANIDTGGTFVDIDTDTDANDAVKWGRLGMKPPGSSVATGVGAKFDYDCALGVCSARRNSGAGSYQATLSLTGVWGCVGGYTSMTNGGCTLS